MKTIASSLLKGLLVIILFTGVSIVLSASGVPLISTANAAVNGTISLNKNVLGKQVRLSSADRGINEFLVQRGYEVISVRRVNSNWSATVISPSGEYLNILVNINTNQILSQTDVAL